MSATFILEYGGMPVRFAKDGCERPIHQLVRDGQGTVFTSEAEAWRAAYQNNLTPGLCRVVNLSQGLRTVNPT